MKKLKLEELNRPNVEVFKAALKIPVIVVLDNVRSALNVGSFFRTCDAFNIEKLILLGITATPPNREITKSAIGATESVEWIHLENIGQVKSVLSDEGYVYIAIEQTNQSVNLSKYPINRQSKYVLIFGNEVDGVSDEALSNCTDSIEIPQLGTKHSLNVAVCGGVVLWEFFKKYTQS
jgi:23S rRNA (guanosine2251-2'-O)-methyltransferase